MRKETLEKVVLVCAREEAEREPHLCPQVPHHQLRTPFQSEPPPHPPPRYCLIQLGFSHCVTLGLQLCPLGLSFPTVKQSGWADEVISQVLCLSALELI